jgi:hypothetical protein
MARGLLWIAALAGLVAGASLTTHRRNQRERTASPAQPEPLNRWEGEGGGVPVTVSSTGELKNARQVSPQTP